MIRDPAPRADLLHDDIGGDFKEKIADEEKSGAKAKNGLREAQIAIHGQGRDADIHPIDERQKIAEHQKRNDPPGDSFQGFAFKHHDSPTFMR
jgi:hypothetical protein